MRNALPSLLLGLLFLSVGAFIGTIHGLRPLSNVIKRFPGDAHSVTTREKALECHADDPESWGYDACSILIRCILESLDDLFKSDLTIGTTILGLVPSILIIAAAQPEDIVRLALVSPHRALAVSIFGISLSPSLYVRATPLKSELREDSKRTWDIELSRFTKRTSCKHVACKALADLSILAMASVALWQCWIVNSAAMVQWLCESPLLLFTWPLANMTWVVFAVLLLHSMAESIEFKNPSMDISYAWWEVLLLPYTLDFEKRLKLEVKWIPISASSIGQMFEIPYLCLVTDRPAGSSRTYTIRIIVKMSEDLYTLKWQMYFFIIEFCAIGIYFYATFVLLSAVFIGAVGSVRFGAMMAGLYAAIRFVQCVF
ncbi:uncharacterized protein B0J16DRAFT_117308 [Fusarium flagelliforme]|uniref:Uncharacterized protein n=1 Tax=Fusarium flagelliforme TaxID=2675880 RepID=A0A395MQL5_9HYPO|nr:uncharacterized protein B0J16DRAFT_117308 [Fusarium flagelliforme]KAH7189581.1 hypothetical protein B0J16DRAFT_117308 [Fusarium flagelliforme]RFN50234.1 hypothetical protein FIE12Z_5413 [Fusarium flagelliforme]